jgi:hypothetical protein
MFGEVQMIAALTTILRFALLAAALMGGVSPSRGQIVDLASGWGPSVMEIAQLPDYCQAFFRERRTPPNCDGVHHLCAGKVLITRLSNVSIPKVERQRILRMAKSEVNYMFGRKNDQCLYMDHARATQIQLQTWEMMLR